MVKYIKPTLKTKYHIDFNWWAEESRSLHRTLLEHLCDECRKAYEADPEIKTMDWVDPETAQVFTVDQLWYTIQTQCSQKSEFLADQLPLTSAIFRLFIAKNNTPLTSVEIQQHLHKRDADTILRTIGGKVVFKGIRPVIPLISS